MALPVLKCNLCGQSAGSRCAACGMVGYCSREHQKADWKNHRLACKEFSAMKSKGQEWEADVRASEYAGTFRWSQKTDFTPMPPFHIAPALDSGWQEYFQTRFEDVPEQKVVLDVALLDGMSFPMSFVYALRCLLDTNGEVKDSLFKGERKLSIVALGSAERAEEHILRQTNYFQEISNLMPSFTLHLWLVGPEMSAAGHLGSRAQGPKMTASCFRGTFSGFRAHQQASGINTGKTIVVGFNTGMASGDERLQESWKQDVEEILRSKTLAIFTCANDYNDLKCESALMASLGAKYVLAPQKNPFGAVTTLHPPGQQETGWYSANSHLYAVQGVAESTASVDGARTNGGVAPSPATGAAASTSDRPRGQDTRVSHSSALGAHNGAQAGPASRDGSFTASVQDVTGQLGSKGGQETPASHGSAVPVASQSNVCDEADLYLPD